MSELQSSFGGVSADAFQKVLVSVLAYPTRTADVLCKRQIASIENHLRKVDSITTIIEKNYIDHDFMEDYSAYYARCFNQYGRLCTRLHFFSAVLGEDEIKNGIVEDNQEFVRKITSSYLGFVVLRPLPLKIIGRTCLVAGKKGDTCHFKALCDVDVTFFGYSLSVRCMPFQEQDKIVAACATSALWSSFYVTARLFRHSMLTPSKITSVAKERGESVSRAIPNRYGLTAVEMSHAIKYLGLETISVNISDLVFQQKYSVLGNIYAYLNLGVPLLLMGDLIFPNGKKKGKHAVSINGYKFGVEEKKRLLLPANRLYACRINEVYVNDDGVGPYVKMTIPKEFPKGIDGFVFETLWNEEETKLLFKPSMLLVPIYSRICVSYDDVWSMAYDFDKYLMLYLGKVRFEWEIVLESGKNVKQLIHNLSDMGKIQRQELLLSGLPKYVWVIRLYIKGNLNSIFCIDATDARQGLSTVFAFCRSEDMLRVAKKFKEVGFFTGRPNAIFDACCVAAKL